MTDKPMYESESANNLVNIYRTAVDNLVRIPADLSDLENVENSVDDMDNPGDPEANRKNEGTGKVEAKSSDKDDKDRARNKKDQDKKKNKKKKKADKKKQRNQQEKDEKRARKEQGTAPKETRSEAKRKKEPANGNVVDIDPKKASTKFKKNSEAATRTILTSTQAKQARAQAEMEKLRKKEEEKRNSALKEFRHLYPYMQNRELSWLEFNKRVLDQGADATVPLFERLNFISIFWSNLQEFFMVRVGSLTDLSLLKKAVIDSKSGMTPTEQLRVVYERCHELYPYYEKCYKNLRGLLANEGIVNMTNKDVDDDARDYLEDYFSLNVMPFLSPQIINSRHPFPHLENGALYIVVRLNEEASKDELRAGKNDKTGKAAKHKGKNVGAEGVTLGLIPLPSQCERIIEIPSAEGELRFILLEHLIEMFVPQIFSMYKVKHTNVICVTRNADLDANEGSEEQGEDYREHMRRILKKRARLAPVRLESERELSPNVKPVLLDRLNLDESQTFVSSVPLDMSYVFELPARVSEEKRAALTFAPFDPQWPVSLDRTRPIMEQVIEHEVLENYPYETMDVLAQLLREAAFDPSVVSIKITLYRMAKSSHLAEALIAAAENGKEVTALFELRARFDEANNIEWSQRFEEAGCKVIYGFKDYKVHSKVCCITRETPEGLQFITQLGTGNYNEKTAKLYTDFSFMTADQSIGLDTMRFFNNMALENLSDEYDTLWVAPLQIKQNIMREIDNQIERNRRGLSSGLFFKTNSVTDKEIIDKIVEASQAGVQCMMFVRGISCLVPGIEGYTDNVRVTSIVGHLLEHSRIFAFGALNENGGTRNTDGAGAAYRVGGSSGAASEPSDGVKIYLSSADLMTRNMDKRIEIAWPLKDAKMRDLVIGYIATCMADTAKLRELMPTKTYTDLGYFADPAGTAGDVELLDSQSFLIDKAERQEMLALEESIAPRVYDTEFVRAVEQGEIEAERLDEKLHADIPEEMGGPLQPRSDRFDAGGAREDAPTEVVADAVSPVDVASEADAVSLASATAEADADPYAESVAYAVVGIPTEDFAGYAEAVQPGQTVQSAQQAYIDEPLNLTEDAPSTLQELPLDLPSDFLEPPIATDVAATSETTWRQVQVDAPAQTEEVPLEQAYDQIVRDFPQIAGAGKFDVVPNELANEDMEHLEIPNLESQETMRVAIEQSQYTDPATSPEPILMPKEKKPLWKRIFGD